MSFQATERNRWSYRESSGLALRTVNGRPRMILADFIHAV